MHARMHSGQQRRSFLPQTGQEKMKTFSSICDKFVEAMGYEKYQCASEDDARQYAATHLPGPKYPVYYSASNTTGEKDFEEFYVDGESTDMERFESLGVITNTDQQKHRVCKRTLSSASKRSLPNAHSPKPMLSRCSKNIYQISLTWKKASTSTTRCKP